MNGASGACSAYGGGVAYTRFWWGNLRERVHLGDPDVEGRVKLKWILGSVMLGYGLDRDGSG